MIHFEIDLSSGQTFWMPPGVSRIQASCMGLYYFIYIGRRWLGACPESIGIELPRPEVANDNRLAWTELHRRKAL